MLTIIRLYKPDQLFRYELQMCPGEIRNIIDLRDHVLITDFYAIFMVLPFRHIIVDIGPFSEQNHYFAFFSQ